MKDNDADISLFTQDATSVSTQIKTSYTGIASTIFNLLNSALGAGMLSISNSFTFCGIIPAIGILTLCAIMSFIACSMTVKMHTLTSAPSLQKLAEMALGNIGTTITNWSIILFCYSCMVAYLIMGTEIIQSWAEAMGYNLRGTWERMAVILIYSFALPIMLSIPRDIHFLGYVSFSCVVGEMIYLCGMVYKAIVLFPKQGIDPTVESSLINIHIFNAMGVHILSFSLTCVIVPITKHMVPSISKRNLACGITFFSAFVIIIVPSTIGYLMFGASCQPLILNNFDSDDILFIFIRISCFIILVTSYPVIGLSLNSLISKALYNTEEHQLLPWKKRSLCLLIENAIPLTIAILLPNSRPALAIGGALGGGITNFILPPIIWIKIYKKSTKEFMTWVMIIFAFVGTIASSIATYEAILDSIKAFSNK